MPPNVASTRQASVYLDGLRGRRPRVPVDPVALERAARRAMSARAFAYVAGGAGAEETVAANRAALERWRIVPRVLRDVSRSDTTCTLFGQSLSAPVFLSPIGVLELAHPDADLAVARAAATLGVPMTFSSQASVPMERCADAMQGSPRWFQLYWSKDDDLVASFVERAERCGCTALLVTLDTTFLGWRPRDLDLGYLPFLHGKGIAQYTSDPVFMSRLREPVEGPSPERGRVTLSALRAAVAMARAVPGPTLGHLRSGTALAAVRRFIATYSRPALRWEDLAWLRARTRLPIVLKGVLHPDDARRAVDEGMDGVMVSTHGGRQVDGSIASADALPDVSDAVRGRVPVLFDSGVRGGADVVRALALGASAVGLGRPWVYGLALGGEEGVHDVVANVLAELQLTMALAGRTSIADVTRDVVRDKG